MRKLFMATAWLVVLAPTGLAAEEAPADARVKAALDRLKLKYTISLDDFRLKYDREGDRSQVAFVNSNTVEFGGLEIREVTSTAYKVKGPLSAKAAHALLVDNDHRKIGAWRAVEEEGDTFVIFAVQIPATADDKTLQLAIDAVVNTADDKEKEATNKDEF